jgi:hypothetical protein
MASCSHLVPTEYDHCLATPRRLDLALRKIGMTNFKDLIATASNHLIPTKSSTYLRIKATLVEYVCNVGTTYSLKDRASSYRALSHGDWLAVCQVALFFIRDHISKSRESGGDGRTVA